MSKSIKKIGRPKSLLASFWRRVRGCGEGVDIVGFGLLAGVMRRILWVGFETGNWWWYGGGKRGCLDRFAGSTFRSRAKKVHARTRKEGAI